MRVKQTARKSTGAAHHLSGSSSSGSPDPMQTRMRSLLQTKRKSATPSQGKKFEAPSGKGKGKRVPYGNYDAAVKTKPKAKSGTVALKDIRKLQQTWELLIPRAPFHRLVREITQRVVDHRYPNNDGPQIKYQTAALEAIQEAAESFLTNLFEDSYLCTTHAKRVTLFVSDMLLCQRLQYRDAIRR